MTGSFSCPGDSAVKASKEDPVNRKATAGGPGFFSDSSLEASEGRRHTFGLYLTFRDSLIEFQNQPMRLVHELERGAQKSLFAFGANARQDGRP